MIKSWRHKGLKRFYETGSTSGIQPHHAEIIQMLLFQLACSVSPKDMDTPGNDFHPLIGELNEFYSVKVNKNWRIIFKFDDDNATMVNLLDYH